jgi:hypothetical protein
LARPFTTALCEIICSRLRKKWQAEMTYGTN